MDKTRDKIYFASDMHLGMHPINESRKRELAIVQWLSSIKNDAKALWLLGDIFDYWFEYKKVVPRGYSRFIGKLAELADHGIDIHIFAGNHDVWYFNYFPDEIGAKIYHEPITLNIGGKNFYLAHGDGLTGKDKIYLLLKSIFRNKALQWLYARVHPNGAAAFAQWWSKKSRYSKALVYPYKGEANEEQIQFARRLLKNQPDIDLFIFGHRHIPYDVKINEKSRVICLGDWISSNTYGVFDGVSFNLKKYGVEDGS